MNLCLDYPAPRTPLYPLLVSLFRIKKERQNPVVVLCFAFHLLSFLPSAVPFFSVSIAHHVLLVPFMTEYNPVRPRCGPVTWVRCFPTPTALSALFLSACVSLFFACVRISFRPVPPLLWLSFSLAIASVRVCSWTQELQSPLFLSLPCCALLHVCGVGATGAREPSG